MQDVLKHINSDYGNLLLALISIAIALYARNEYVNKKNPCIVFELFPVFSTNIITFSLKCHNYGQYPAMIQFKRIVLNIGDETYPTEHKHAIFLNPGESKLMLSIGQINETGIDNIKGGFFHKNTVSIEIEAKAKCSFDTYYSFEIINIIGVNIRKNPPTLDLLKHTQKKIPLLKRLVSRLS